MQKVEMESQLRKSVGKGAARKIRREGRIPAVLYGSGTSTPLTIDPTGLVQILRSESGENALINLKVVKGDSDDSMVTAILRDFQRDPVTGEFLHADLFEVSMTEVLRVRIPLVMVGDPAGVKEGGVLQHSLRELEIECLPQDIPEHVNVSIADLGIGDSIHVRDLVIAPGIKVLDDPEQSIVSIAAPISEAELEKMLTGTPVEGESKEPEVVSKGKEKTGPEGGTEESASPQKAESGKKKGD